MKNCLKGWLGIHPQPALWVEVIGCLVKAAAPKAQPAAGRIQSDLPEVWDSSFRF